VAEDPTPDGVETTQQKDDLMAYDDESSRFGFRDWDDILAGYFAQADNITFGRLRTAVQVLGAMGGMGAAALTLAEVEEALAEHGLGSLPISTVVGIVEVTAPIAGVAGEEDVASRLTLKDLERALSRGQRY
jgi:hypothetical protein